MKLPKLKKIDLKKLDFNILAPFLVGFIIILFTIYTIFFRTTNTTQDTFESPATEVEENQQLHKNKPILLPSQLPIVDEDYIIDLEEDNNEAFIVINYNVDNPNSLEKAYLYLKQFGIFQGDNNIREKSFNSEELGPS